MITNTVQWYSRQGMYTLLWNVCLAQGPAARRSTQWGFQQWNTMASCPQHMTLNSKWCSFEYLPKLVYQYQAVWLARVGQSQKVAKRAIIWLDSSDRSQNRFRVCRKYSEVWNTIKTCTQDSLQTMLKSGGPLTLQDPLHSSPFQSFCRNIFVEIQKYIFQKNESCYFSPIHFVWR